MKQLITATLLCLLLAAPARADFASGKAAYESGDYATAMEELKPLALSGNAQAQRMLGEMYRWGMGVPDDYERAFAWWLIAAEQGGAVAQFRLGQAYSGGTGVEQDHKEAAHWYKLSADQGYAPAQRNLASLYSGGNGVQQDHVKAALWNKLAAEQGDLSAQESLAKAYEKGLGVLQDSKEALHRYEEAAKHSRASAMRELGRIFQEGKLAEQDLIEAHKWFNVSAMAYEQKVSKESSSQDRESDVLATLNGLLAEDSRESMNAVAKELSPAQIAEAQKLAREWWDEYGKGTESPL